MKIRINSGFERGGKLLSWDGEKFAVMGSVSPCTWQGDTDDSQEWELSDEFRGAAVRWYTDGHTRVPTAELIGFTADELASPSPVQGWGLLLVGADAARYERLNTFAQYLDALAEHGEDGILTDAAVLATARQYKNQSVAEIPYEWGCQAAQHYAIFKDGILVEEVLGCGDNAPYLTETGEIRSQVE